MAAPEKPSRLGRGLDALLARREPPKPAEAAPTPATVVETASGTANTDTTTPASASAANAPSANTSARDVLTGSVTPTANPVATTKPTSQAAGASGVPAQADAATSSAPASVTETRSAAPSVSTENPSGAARSSAVGSSAALSTTAAQPSSPRAENSNTVTTESQTSSYRLLPIAHIAANPFQPRKEFHPQDLADLQSSLKSQGLLQPITVRPSPNHTGYELIAGERRLRAATQLGWKEIPGIVRETNDRTMLTLAMVENLQRADLDPIEEADGYQRMVDDFALTQQEVADVVGKERSTIANALRLLALPASVKRMLQEKKLSVGHARAMLPLETERAMAELARDIIAKTLSVRDVEERVRAARPSPAKSGRKAKPADSGVAPATPAAGAEMRRVEELLRKKMQTSVSLHLTGKERGEVRISFFSNDDLERVLDMLGVNLDS